MAFEKVPNSTSERASSKLSQQPATQIDSAARSACARQKMGEGEPHRSLSNPSLVNAWSSLFLEAIKISRLSPSTSNGDVQCWILIRTTPYSDTAASPASGSVTLVRSKSWAPTLSRKLDVRTAAHASSERDARFAPARHVTHCTHCFQGRTFFWVGNDSDP